MRDARSERPETEAVQGERVVQAGEVRSARIESLRAIAALGVVLSHAVGFAYAGREAEIYGSWPLQVLYGGGYGVVLFFALTGYLLYLPFARRDLTGGPRLELRTYARNRALRVLPLYYVCVVLLLLVQEGGGSVEQWSRFLTLTENFDRTTIATVNGPLWSLVIEVHFYLLLPLLAVVLARLARGSMRRAALLIGGLGLVSLAVWKAKVHATPDPLWQLSLPATFLYFVPGMLVALLRLRWQQHPPTWLRGAAGSSTVWLLAAVPPAAVAMDRPDLSPVLTVSCFLVLGACVLPLRGGWPLARLEWRPLAAVGIASYSLYVWHVPIMQQLRGPLDDNGWLLAGVAGSLAVAAAFVSYRLVEAPFLRLRRRWQRPQTGASPTAPVGAPATASATASRST